MLACYAPPKLQRCIAAAGERASAARWRWPACAPVCAARSVLIGAQAGAALIRASQHKQRTFCGDPDLGPTPRGLNALGRPARAAGTPPAQGRPGRARPDGDRRRGARDCRGRGARRPGPCARAAHRSRVFCAARAGEAHSRTRRATLRRPTTSCAPSCASSTRWRASAACWCAGRARCTAQRETATGARARAWAGSAAARPTPPTTTAPTAARHQGWDEMVMMPAGAANSRGAQKAALSGIIHDKRTDAETGTLLGALGACPVRRGGVDAVLQCCSPAQRSSKRGAACPSHSANVDACGCHITLCSLRPPHTRTANTCASSRQR